MIKKILVFSLIAIMVLSISPSLTLATDGTIGSDGIYDISSYGNNSIITISGNHTVTLTNSTNTKYSNIQIVCKSSNGIGVNLTLSNVQIDNSAYSDACALSFFDDSTNQLELIGDSSLVSGDNRAGISVQSGTSLEISGSGSIVVKGGEAGIGGGGDVSTSQAAGEISIKSGTIMASSKGNGAGIGGGGEGNGGTINITGGSITASGYYYGAGIGGGNNANGGVISITGGTINATGGYNAAAIGGGSRGAAGTISIEGGTVYADKGVAGGPLDIGYGSYVTGGTFSLTNKAVVFLKNGKSLAPDTFTHDLYTVNIEDHKAFGLSVPETWEGLAYAYLKSSNVYMLEYSANGGNGTAPNTITQYYNTTTTMPDGLGMTNGTLAFSRWNTAADGSGTDYYYKDTLTFTSNKTLYAIYEDIFTQGNGTDSNPFSVTNPEQLNALRYFTSANFIMLNDIDMSTSTNKDGAYYFDGAGWEPIQNFSGVFDGGGYEITGLQINRPEGEEEAADYVGLFGELIEDAIVRNVGLNDANILGTDYVGGISGSVSINAAISNCYISGHITAVDHSQIVSLYAGAGGISGICVGEITCCYNTGEIYSDKYAGGIAGSIIDSGTINNCYNIGNIGSGYKCAGIVGISSRSTISNCYNLGSTEGLYALAAATSNSVYENCYYIDNDYNATDNNSTTTISNVAAKSIEEMQLQSSYTGYDFDNVWAMGGNENYPCPELQSVAHIEPLHNTTDFAGGNGLPYSPYCISTPEQLNQVRNYLGSWYILCNDIDLSAVTGEGGMYYYGGQGWNPIGDETNYFYGRFDGGTYSIGGLNINRPEQDYIGLFGYILNYDMPAVKDLNLKICSISGHEYTGAIAGYSHSIIQACYCEGIVNGETRVAGIAGSSFKCIDCENACDVYGNQYVGGISAYNTGTIVDCTNSGEITGDNYVGGIVGQSSTQVTNCSNTGTISGDYYVGGIIASNHAEVTTCINSGRVAGKSWIGGIIGTSNNGNITYCCNTASVGASANYCGGIIGESDGCIISCCYNTGWITGQYSGGIVGSAPVNVLNCYNTGKITGTTKSGGIAGDVSDDSIIDCCYNAWNQYGDNIYGFIIDSTENANVANCFYLYEGDVDLGSEAKTREELYQQDTFENFNFTDVWEIIEGERLPVLQNMPFDYTTGISLSEETVTLNPDEEVNIVATTVPNNASNQSIIWTSSNESVAIIDDVGITPINDGKMRITAVSGGATTITAITVDGGYVGSCEVIVLQSVTGVTLNQTELDLNVNDTVSLIATVTPSNATNKDLTWFSDNESVITVENGTVTAIGAGTATITVTTADGGFSDTCAVSVQVMQIASSVYTIDRSAGLLTDVSINTSVAQLKANLTNDAADIKVYDKNGVEYTGDFIASGMVVKLIINEIVRDELTVSVRGDVSGNGQIDIADYILIRSSLYGLISLDTLQFSSADVNKSGNIDIADYILVRSHMYGLTQI